MSSRDQTRQSGSSYLVKFFEDSETLVVNRSRIFKEGRIKVGDKANIQWGKNSNESSDGEILEMGDYAELQKRRTALKHKDNTTCTKRQQKKRQPNKTEKENTSPAPKKLKSGVSFELLSKFILYTYWQVTSKRNKNSVFYDKKGFANNADHHQTSQNVFSDQGLH